MSAISKLKAISNYDDIWLGKHDNRPYPEALNLIFSALVMNTAQSEIATWPSYKPTKLRKLDNISEAAGVGAVYYKDESSRFGLGSFKALGGAYAVLHYLSQVLSDRLGKTVSIGEIRAGTFADEVSKIVVATATDGNHGRSVAWGAQLAGCKCRIYIHAEVSQGREEAMAAFGADVIRIDGDYDQSVRLAAKEADENGWQIISDTSYEGYQEIPKQVMAGYTIMVREILDQIEKPLTHVIVQAGVGGLAASICAALWAELGVNRPRFIVTESVHAACIIESLRNDKVTEVSVDQETIMAGLSCGEISMIAFDILSKGSNAVTTISDEAVIPAMQLMASRGIEAGECGVPGIITTLALTKDKDVSQQLQIDEHSQILVFGCEGATDPDLYQSLLATSV